MPPSKQSTAFWQWQLQLQFQVVNVCVFYTRCRKDTFDESSQLSEKCIARGGFKVSNLMKLRNLYSLLALGVSLLIVGLVLVVLM